jgi:hypothetical protein
MALIDRVKERTGSDLSDAELQAMIDAITAELNARFGVVGPATVTLGDLNDPNNRFYRTMRLVLPIDTAQPVTIIEKQPGNTGLPENETELAADDFSVLDNGRTLQRLLGGSNPREFWAPIVRVTYTPQSNAAQRDEVTIKLIQLDLSYRGALRSEKAGDYSFTLSGDMAADREAILQTLGDRRGMVMA